MDRSEIIERAADDQRAWCEDALKILYDLVSQKAVVTSDDLWPFVDFPKGKSGGRVFGKVILEALRRGWIEKNKVDGFWLALDKSDIPVVHSADGVVIAHKSALPTYRSLLVT